MCACGRHGHNRDAAIFKNGTYVLELVGLRIENIKSFIQGADPQLMKIIFQYTRDVERQRWKHIGDRLVIICCIQTRLIKPFLGADP